MFGTILNVLLGKAVPAAADFFLKKEALEQEVKLERLKGKIAWEQALTRRAEASEGRDHEWEIEQIKNSGYKDEWILFLISIPLVGSFVPNWQDDVLVGFKTLEQTPLWYQGMVVTIFMAVYGIRKWRRKTAVDKLIDKEKADP